MACDDCYTNNDCRGEFGTFDDKHQTDSVPKDASCEEPNEWEYVHTVNPQNADTESYDEVEGSYKRIYLNSWFQKEPDDHIEDSCEEQLGIGSFYASPQSVEYRVRHPYDESVTEYEFNKPRPQDDGSGESFITNTALDIAPVLSGHPLVKAGSAVIKNYIGSTSNSNVDITSYDSDRQELRWDLDYDSNGDWPTAPCDTTGVRFHLSPGTNSGSHTVNTWARYTMSVHDYIDGYECACDEAAISGYIHTTDWLKNSVTFTFNG